MADDAGVEQIRDAVIEKESRRTDGGKPTVDYGMDMRQAVSEYDGARFMYEMSDEEFGKIKPVGKNRLGNIYDQFRGQPQRAFAFLLRNQEGYLPGVYHRDDIGDIDLVWGTAPNDHNGKGLAHIIRKHIDFYQDFRDINEAFDVISDVIEGGEARQDTNDNQLINIEKSNYRVVVVKNGDGNWILSAFDFVTSKKKKLERKGKTPPPSGTPGQPYEEAGAVTSNLSDNKYTEISPNSQENPQENTQDRANFMRETSREYMDAVESGDEEKAGRMVREAAKRAMPDTEVTDEDGYPLKMYHGSDEEFWVFKKYSNTGVTNRYDETPSDHFLFADDEAAASDYGETKAVYLNARNLLRAESREAVVDIIRKQMEFINDIAPADWRIDEDNVDDFIERFVGEDGRLFSGSDESEQEAVECWRAIQNAIADYARKNDFDGFAFNDNTRGEGHKTYAVFDPNQIKSAAPVTYDDAGNVIPLEERFDEGKDDVRFMREEEKEYGKKRDISVLPADELTKNELNVEQKRLSNIIDKHARIEKLRKADYASISGKEIDLSGSDKEKKRSALKLGKTLQGSYTNDDTGDSILLQRGRKNGGILEVLQHNYKDIPHLQSIAAIPQIIQKSIYIDSEKNTDTITNPNVTEIQHFICGLKIGNEDYTVHALIAVDDKGNRYYDHNLIQIEKGKLLDHVSGQAVIKGFGTTPGTKPTTNYERKINNLVALLQINLEEISLARQRLREIKTEIEHRSNPINKPELSNSPEKYAEYLDAVEQERSSIKAKAQDDVTFMKSPNGKDSNLSEENWLEARTPGFMREGEGVSK